LDKMFGKHINGLGWSGIRIRYGDMLEVDAGSQDNVIIDEIDVCDTF